MDIFIRRLGEHRGAPRLYLDSPALARAGFAPGVAFVVQATDRQITLQRHDAGGRKVSRKLRGERCLPVIDLNSQDDLAPVASMGLVRIVIRPGQIHILAIASQARASERAGRLKDRLTQGLPLRTASIAFGTGITAWALHQGLAAGGVDTTLQLANEIDDELLQHAARCHPLIQPDTVLASTPMQEAVTDLWLLKQVGPVEILEAGIPCSGASKAGVSKRRLGRMEDHPLVGHLVAAVIQWIAALQPAIFLAENVPEYADSASASVLRAWLADAGYVVREWTLNAQDFGSLEARKRWFIVAHPAGMEVEAPQPGIEVEGSIAVLADLLDDVPADDPRWRAVQYLKDKEERDADKGSCFAMQWLQPESTRVPTLRKGYHKGGSTDPRLCHPTRAELSRLLTAAEHARIKGVPAELLQGLSESAAHEACGQAVDARPVKALGRTMALSLLQARAWVTRCDALPTGHERSGVAA